MNKQIVELKCGEELIIGLATGEEIVITRIKGNRKKLHIKMPDWMRAWKGRERAAEHKPKTVLRVVAQ